MSRLLVRLHRGNYVLVVKSLNFRLDVLSSVKPGHLSKLGPALFGYYGVIEKRPGPSFTVASPGVVVTTITAVPTEKKLRGP